MVIAASVSLYLFIQEGPKDPAAAFYLPQFRAWELLSGAILALGQARHATLGYPLRWDKGNFKFTNKVSMSYPSAIFIDSISFWAQLC